MFFLTASANDIWLQQYVFVWFHPVFGTCRWSLSTHPPCLTPQSLPLSASVSQGFWLEKADPMADKGRMHEISPCFRRFGLGYGACGVWLQRRWIVVSQQTFHFYYYYDKLRINRRATKGNVRRCSLWVDGKDDGHDQEHVPYERVQTHNNWGKEGVYLRTCRGLLLQDLNGFITLNSPSKSELWHWPTQRFTEATPRPVTSHLQPASIQVDDGNSGYGLGKSEARQQKSTYWRRWQNH